MACPDTQNSCQWATPVAVAVAANEDFAGADAVFVADENNNAIFWYNANSGANSASGYTPKIIGDDSSPTPNVFGGQWTTGPLTGTYIGSPIALAALSFANSQPRMYIALTTGGVVFYSKGADMVPLGTGGVNSNGGCPFASPTAQNIIAAFAVDKFGNLYIVGRPQSSSTSEAHVCRKPDPSDATIFLGGEILVTNALRNPTGIAVKC
jgi:hypothetical protein